MNTVEITKGKYKGKKIGDLNFMQLVACAKDLEVFVNNNSQDDMKVAIIGAVGAEVPKETPASESNKEESTDTSKTPKKGDKGEKTTKKADKKETKKKDPEPDVKVTKEAQAIVDAVSQKKIGHILNPNAPPKGKQIHRSQAVRELKKLKYSDRQVGELINMAEKDVYNVQWCDRRKAGRKANAAEAQKVADKKAVEKAKAKAAKEKEEGKGKNKK